MEYPQSVVIGLNLWIPCASKAVGSGQSPSTVSNSGPLRQVVLSLSVILPWDVGLHSPIASGPEPVPGLPIAPQSLKPAPPAITSGLQFSSPETMWQLKQGTQALLQECLNHSNFYS